MFYSIYGRNLSAALVTEDGVVRQTTENFDWARGRRIGPVLGYVQRHKLCWEVSAKPPAGLVVRDGTAALAH